jgi:transposase, IS30 family
MAGRKRRKTWWMTPADRVVIEARLRAGELPRAIAADFDCSDATVRTVRRDLWLRRRVTDSGFRLSFEERVEVAVRVAGGESNAQIARAIGRHRSTVGREIKRAVARGHYRPVPAQRKADRLARRPKPTRLRANAGLLCEVEAGLEAGWSPQQISARLRERFPDDRGMRISHETIYLSLFVQSRGELRRELTAKLRTGRRSRKSQGQIQKRGRIVGMVNISERPAEVEDRAVPGHWEGDLIVGAHGRSAVMTLVERQTRYVMLAKLEDQTSIHVTEVLANRIRGLPEHLVRSLTWDQGKELAAHKRFTDQTGIQVYFCDPSSPWQRGSNENTNGLLRQYLPKSSDLSVHTQTQLDDIAVELNGRPRQTLGWWNPAEKMAQLLGEEVKPFER